MPARAPCAGLGVPDPSQSSRPFSLKYFSAPGCRGMEVWVAAFSRVRPLAEGWEPWIFSRFSSVKKRAHRS